MPRRKRFWTRNRVQPLPKGVEPFDLTRLRAAVAALVAETRTGSGPSLIAWPGDLRLPILARFEAAGNEAKAGLMQWASQSRLRLQFERASVSGAAEVLRRELEEIRGRKRKAEEKVEHSDTPGGSQGGPLISEFISFIITVAAFLADFWVLQRVFQNIDVNETFASASILSAMLSLMVMLGGLILGRAWYRHTNMSQTKGDGPVAYALGSLMLGLVVTIGIMRATMVKPADTVLPFIGIDPRTVAGIGFILVQVTALAVAAAAAYFAYRARNFRDARSTTLRILRRRDVVLTRRLSGMEIRVEQLGQHIESIGEVGASTVDEIDALVEQARQEALTIEAARLDLAGFHVLDIVNENEETWSATTP